MYQENRKRIPILVTIWMEALRYQGSWTIWERRMAGKTRSLQNVTGPCLSLSRNILDSIDLRIRKIVFQNWIRPDNLVVIDEKTMGIGKYWVSLHDHYYIWAHIIMLLLHKLVHYVWDLKLKYKKLPCPSVVVLVVTKIARSLVLGVHAPRCAGQRTVQEIHTTPI